MDTVAGDSSQSIKQKLHCVTPFSYNFFRKQSCDQIEPLCFFCFLLCLHPDLAWSKTLWSLLHKILFSAFPRCYIYLANRLWEQSSLSARMCQLDVTPNSPLRFIRKCAEVKRLKRQVFPIFPC